MGVDDHWCRLWESNLSKCAYIFIHKGHFSKYCYILHPVFKAWLHINYEKDKSSPGTLVFFSRLPGWDESLWVKFKWVWGAFRTIYYKELASVVADILGKTLASQGPRAAIRES